MSYHRPWRTTQNNLDAASKRCAAANFGIVYALVAVLGYVCGNSPLLGMMAHNKADIGLHIVIAAVSLFIGFAGARDTVSATR